MRQNPSDDELLRSYLLGQLPEDEADRLEQRLLLDDELFLLSEAIEAELLAAADRDELAPAERERVLRRLASSPQGLERLAFARSLNQAANPAPASVVVPFPQRRTPPAFRWAALAAALVAAAGLSWYVVSSQPGGDSPPVVVQERPALADARPVTKPVAPPPPSSPETVQAEPSRVVFQLALVSLRGSEAAETLRIPAGSELVELQLFGDDLESFQTFSVTVRDESGAAIWEKSGVRAKKRELGPAVVVEVPADRLPAGTYEIQTRGVAPGQEPEELAPLEVEIVWKPKG
ncbi:MAG: hypothetical protein ACJ75H_06405 [Thermoanaerobaculia bacterium]